SGNTNDCYPFGFGTPTINSQGYNLIGDTTGCVITGDTTGNKSGVAPNLGPLRDNGGPTFTHALLTGSPAIDAGNPAAPGSGGNACPVDDQRGVTRPQDGDGDTTAVCDIGAYELEASSSCGNGQVDSGETCDDGNTTSGDGCSSTCQTESGYACTGTP